MGAGAGFAAPFFSGIDKPCQSCCPVSLAAEAQTGADGAAS